MMDFVLDHRAEPLSDAQLDAAGRHALLLEIVVAERAEDRHGLVVHPLHEVDDPVVTIAELAAVTGIPARFALRVLREHPALDRGEMPHQIAEGELAFFVGPVEAIGRDACGDAHGPLPNAIEPAYKLG